MQRISIVGLGLIGGSTGLGLRAWSAANGNTLEITGFDTDLAQQQYAKKIKAVDRTAWQLAQAVKDADIVIVSTPVMAMRETFTDIAPHLKAGAVVTDTGSTKTQVLAWADELLPRTVNFVGGHPMAGSHERGLAHAAAGLFRDSPYALIGGGPGQRGLDAIALRLIIEAVRALGARPVVISAERHDRAVAAISHAPQLLSTALALLAADAGDGTLARLAGAGFADMTRLAAGHWSVWEDICATNGDEIAGELGRVIALLESLRDELAAGRVEQTGRAFRRAAAFVRGLHGGDQTS